MILFTIITQYITTRCKTTIVQTFCAPKAFGQHTYTLDILIIQVGMSLQGICCRTDIQNKYQNDST